MKFETQAIRLQMERSGQREHSTALFPTSSFVFEDAEQMRAIFAGDEQGNVYSRFTNPNCRELEVKMAALEQTEDAFATASGMAAVFATLMTFLQAGDHLIATRALFGSSYQIIANRLPKLGIETSFVDADNPENWQKAIRPTTKMLFIETPSNPGLEIVDLKKAGDFAKAHDLLFCVDNCFATPYLQQPVRYGADLVLHSATKFIDGQGRVLGGIVAGDEKRIQKLREFCRSTGPALSPFNAWILSKSLETLAVRLDRHCQNALTLAEYLQTRSEISQVNYPFLPNHPAQAIAKQQMKLGGGLVTFELKGGLAAGRQFLDQIQLLSLSANLGDTRSIASHPASTTHVRVPEAARLAIGITNGLVRISVGLEHIEDIIADIAQALDKCTSLSH